MTTPNVVRDDPAPSVRVARFARPDVRPALYDHEAIADCSLFKELDEAALSGLAPGQTVVLNFGLIDWFPTAFYRLLLQTREAVLAQGGKLLLCCFTPNVREGFDLMGGGKLFEVRATEANALAPFRK